MSAVRRLASRFDDWLDRMRMRRRGLAGQDDRVIVVPYPGWATRDRIFIRGSVVEEDRIEKPGARDTVWGDLAVTLKRFLANEIMGATVVVSRGEVSVTCITDSDGFFLAALPAGAEPGWSAVTIRLEDFPGRTQPPLEIEAPVLRPSDAARFGVISDIDDTVIRTGISEPLKNWRTIIESDAEARVAFPGLAALYQALQGEDAANPIFYVSSGSWKLYDLIARFKQINGIPRGPVFMDDWGLDETRWFKSSHGAHKTGTIDRIMETYPGLPFILVGDSGQHDAEIYADTMRRHGERIIAVWIRDVSGAARDAEIAGLLREAREAGVAVWVEPDLLDAARDAAARGWIAEADLAAVRAAVETAETSV